MTANRFNFRVWFKPNWQDPEMYYEAEQTYDSACEGKGSDCHYSFGDVLNDKDCIVMQSTGKVDKKNKEAFNGDIVKLYDDNENIAQIVYSVENARFEYRRKNGDFISALCDMELNKYAEVIGNIYENKDILGEQ